MRFNQVVSWCILVLLTMAPYFVRSQTTNTSNDTATNDTTNTSNDTAANDTTKPSNDTATNDTTNTSSSAIEFHIGALAPSYGYDAYGFFTAIKLAIETIHNKSVLQGHKMVVHYKDTVFKASTAIERLIELRNMKPPEAIRTFIIGPGKSDVAAYTARLSTIWGPLQVSYGASTPALSDSHVYPRFLTIVPTSNSLNKALVKMLKYFNWKRVGVIYDVDHKEFFLPTLNKLQVALNAGNFNVMVEEGASIQGDGRSQVIERMKLQDVRIVIALFERKDLPSVMCEAYHQGFYGKRIVWITYMVGEVLTRGYHNSSGCNTSQLRMVTNGMFSLRYLYYRRDKKKTISGLTVDDFRAAMRARKQNHQPQISLTFDTAWLVALALNASLKDAIKVQKSTLSDDFDYLQRIKERMMKIEFEGITGTVKFNGTERLGTIMIRQERMGKFVDICQHNSLNDNLTFINNETASALLAGNYVRDGPVDVYQVYYYSAVLSIIIWIVCSVGIIIALGLFYFNFKNREIRYIKMSSPHLNNIIILGGLLCYVKVLLDTLDSRFMSFETYGLFCNIRVWIMSLGFTTAFGAMFSKTWRVHRIFTASQNFRRAVIKNFHLYGLLVGLLAVDIILLTLWMIFSPYKYDELKLPDQIDKDRDEILHPSIYHCKSKQSSYFLLTMFCYKGLLLTFGIFLAWETRNIEIKALNDSKYIGMSVYNVVILSVVGVLIASLMAGTSRYDLYLALMSLVVILCTAATLGIVFVPKILGLQRILNATANERDACYTTSTNMDADSPCCCCENCRCRCSKRRTSSIHVSNRFLASESQNRRKSSNSSRNASVPNISITKPKLSLRIDARVSLSTCREGDESPPDESPRVGFLAAS